MIDKPLILGIGNYLLGDEGIGCHAIQHLSDLGYETKADLLDGGTGGFHLMDHLTRHETVIMIDATLDHYPEGTVRILKPTGYKDFPQTLSAHEIGLKDLITSLMLVDSMPEIFLIAVSVKDYDELRIDLSQTIADALPMITQKVDRIFEIMEERLVL